MSNAYAVGSDSWDIASGGVSEKRRSIGRISIAVATLALIGVLVFQALHATGRITSGFENWRPVLYVYLIWAITLGAGLVLMRGERGHRALFILPAVLFTVSMVVFPTAFGLYIAFTDWRGVSASP